MDAPAYILRLSQWFIAEPASVPAARHAAENVQGVLGSLACERIGLLVSELVANAVNHGSTRPSDTLRVRVWTSPAAVRVAVTDRGPSFERPREAARERRLEASGWGLYLVERLADRWGVRGGSRTEVWFEVDTSRAAGVPGARSSGCLTPQPTGDRAARAAGSPAAASWTSSAATRSVSR